MLDPARVLADEQLGEVVEDPEHAAAPAREARLADPRQALVGAHEDDDHRIVVPRARQLTGNVSIAVIFIRPSRRLPR